jgi:hypothetical protein
MCDALCRLKEDGIRPLHMQCPIGIAYKARDRSLWAVEVIVYTWKWSLGRAGETVRGSDLGRTLSYSETMRMDDRAPLQKRRVEGIVVVHHTRILMLLLMSKCGGTREAPFKITLRDSRFLTWPVSVPSTSNSTRENRHACPLQLTQTCGSHYPYDESHVVSTCLYHLFPMFMCPPPPPAQTGQGCL